MKFWIPGLLLTLIVLFAGCDMAPPILKARQLNNTGLEYSEKGDKAQAIVYFREAYNVEGVPDSERATFLNNIGEEYFANNPDSAKYYYLQATQLTNRNTYSGLYSRANVDILDKRVDRALDRLLRAYEIDDTKMQANNLLGLIYLGDFDKTYLDPRKALKFNRAAYDVSQNVNTVSLMARNYYLLNDMKQAVPLFEEACKQAPDNPGHLETLTMVYLEMGRTEEANTLMAKLKDMDGPLYDRVISAHIKTGEHTLTWNNN
jgi:tetratricopeptide (TPR) repeat protein